MQIRQNECVTDDGVWGYCWGQSVGKRGDAYFPPAVPRLANKGVVVLMRHEMPVGIAASIYWCGFTWCSTAAVL